MTVPKTFTHDLSLISKWAFKRKMLFNPDPTKRAQEVIFSREKVISAHPNVFLNDIPVKRASHHKNILEYILSKN